MVNRTRKIVLRVPVTPEERKPIEQKMALLHTKNFSAYARKMLIDGYIVNMDTTDVRAQTAEIQEDWRQCKSDCKAAEQHGGRCTHRNDQRT